MSDYAMDNDDFVIDPDADVRLKLEPGTYGVDGNAELVSVVGRTHTFQKDTKRNKAGDKMRWVDFAVAVDTPNGRVFVHTSPWKKVHTKVQAQSGSVVNKLMTQLGLAPQFDTPDEDGNRPLIQPVEGTKVLVTVADDTYVDNNGQGQTTSYITNIERRP